MIQTASAATPASVEPASVLSGSVEPLAHGTPREQITSTDAPWQPEDINRTLRCVPATFKRDVVVTAGPDA